MRITRQVLQRFNADIRASQARAFPDVFEIGGRRFLILKGVFNPLFYDSTEFFAQRLPYPKGKGFFEVGLGSGAIAVTAILQGCSSSMGIDINAKAVRNAILNAKLHGVEKKTAFRVLDIEALETFGDCSLIFWAHPWVKSPGTGRFGVLERSIIDPGYRGLEKFIHLAKCSFPARVFLGFGNTGNYRTLNQLVKKQGLHIKVHEDGISQVDSRYTYQLLELKAGR
jgi:release factor glutamine methyltransferase